MEADLTNEMSETATTSADESASRFTQPGDDRWITRARNSYEASTDWFNSSLRKQAEENLAHFRSQHKPGSKYNTELYQKKSRVFRPKTRSMVRRSDAAMAIAFFSTQDIVHCTAINESKKDQVAAADVHNALLNYRLERTIPWFTIAIGASQDANIHGVVISAQRWDRKTRMQAYADVYQNEDGTTTIEQGQEEVVIKDEPRVDLIPLENFRIDPAADWTDPINSSPYCIELCPMYIGEVREKMSRTNPRTGRPEYRYYEAGVLQAALDQQWDSIRKMRSGQQLDKYENVNAVDDYRIVWVHKGFYRVDGQDWYVETLGNELVLADPELAEDVFPHLHGKERPFAMGYASIEAHMAFPQSPTQMVSGLQEEINDVANLRLDNVKLALNKRWFVRRGMGVDTQTLIRNVPSSAVMMTDTERDVREVQTQDVTRSSYEEQNRLTLEFDELGGNFSAASIGSNRQLNETVGGMNMLAGDASQIQEFQVRTITETWAVTVMRQLVLLEAMYETDEDILDAVAATTKMPLEAVLQVQSIPTFVRCNVGTNATQPEKRIGKLLLAFDALNKINPQIMSGVDTNEVMKEVMGAVGFRDGERFFPAPEGEDPRVKQLQDQVAQLSQALQSKLQETQMKVEGSKAVATIGAQARVMVAQIGMKERMEIAMLQAKIEQGNARLQEMDRIIAAEQVDTKRRELYLEREALSHSISSDNREFQLKLASIAKQSQKDTEPKGAKNLPGNDKAGVISRGDYGAIPQNQF